ncbi:helix-turn-helix transcriptional regulator [Erysipelotrichaceae bacterium RD49]|nr:helix-turn-helix transcriptional regulator [Erysipelotrichaceae bacterium RD49]
MSLQVVMKVCADPINRQILELLRNSSLSAGQISEHFDVSFGAISQHLAALKEADLVRSHRKGRYIIYELNTSVLEQVLVWVQSLCIRDEAVNKQTVSLQMKEDH